ncbi:type IX secretion system protein PorQ [Microbacter margulisiae]|uniref:Type IX secretion system protein PorQ n=1 Tax=Microbacter margulisiae TaxID=1350067 RepID=A0A7W5DPK3_9PORP|nr:type IX secretion system protein PorQ [Microbacter margulisiae]MBB3186435.1 hypothetical protein [Microbacter margulisiae]
MNKKLILLYFLILSVLQLNAQAGNTVYSFLDLPASAHLGAMGGTNVSLYDQDINLAFNNPALLSEDTKNALGLNYTNYLAGINFGSAIYGFNASETNHWALGIRYINYGQFQGYTSDNVSTGTFNAQDYAVNLIYARTLSDKWNIGVAFQPIYSHYEAYSSVGLSANVGLHFHDETSLTSFGIVAKNIGTQITSYDAINGDQAREPLPFEIEMGITKKFEHAPFQLTVTATNLQRWNLNYQENDSIATSGSVVNMLFRHLIFAIDFLPSNHFYLTVAYNDRRASELSIANIRSLSGFSGGFGINISRVRIGFAIAEYQAGSLAYHFSLTTKLSDFGIQ